MDDRVAEPNRAPTVDAVKAALDAFIAWSDLRLSERNRRFLSYVVTETVAGNSERIKAYTIAVDVFGREEDFDASTDPIVRIEATRIRSALASYYEGPGANEPVRISMPPGSYIPDFSWTSRTQSTDDQAQRPCASLLSPRAVVVLHDHSPQSDIEAASKGELLSEALIRRLAQAGLKIHLVPSNDRIAARAAIHRIYAQPERAYALDITVRQLPGQYRYSWRLSDLSTGEVVAVDFRDHDRETPCLNLIDGIAEQVAEFAADVRGKIASQ